MSIYRKKSPRVKTDFRIKPEVLEALKQGAEYHHTGWQTYMQWLIEEGLRIDAEYYGWAKVPIKNQPRDLTLNQKGEVDRLMRLSRRRVRRKRKNAPPKEK